MYDKTQIQNRLTLLINNAENEGFDRDKLEVLVQPLENAIDNFYNINFDYYITNNIEMMTHALIRVGIKYKNYQVATGGNRPKGFDDLTELFNVGSEIVTVDVQTFIDSIEETSLPSDAEGGSTELYQSEFVDRWVNEFLSASMTVPANLQLIGDYAGDFGLVNSIKILYDAPIIESVPNFSDIAKQVYIDRKYKEVIEKLKLSVYVPEYV